MSKNIRIDEIFNILVQYEKVGTEITQKEYISYLDRLYTWYSGYNNEIATGIKGLINLKMDIDHDSLRRMVFHLISIIEKER